MMPHRSSEPWVADEVDAYRLDKDDLEDYLKRKFPLANYGREDFNLQVSTLSSLFPDAVPDGRPVEDQQVQVSGSTSIDRSKYFTGLAAISRK
jgi:hypothetical protein